MGEPELWPQIRAGRFGLEQRSAYRHSDLYDEEVVELELETAVSALKLGAGCAVRSFVLLGDQNAGKSTMLHSFCRESDPGFLQLSSLLPVLSGSFLNTRLMPGSFMDDAEELDRYVNAVRDEIPFMDTDIARGVAVMTLENFRFFCAEFGIVKEDDIDPVSGCPLNPALAFEEDTSFVALQFLELGGDHLDRLVHFSRAGGSMAAVRAAERSELAEDDAFWSDVHEVLLGSLKLLAETHRSVYFINCSMLFPGHTFDPSALRPLLRKLHFLDSALAGGKADQEAEVLFYCSRIREEDLASLDAEHCWRAAASEVAAFLKEELSQGSPLALPPLPRQDEKRPTFDDEGLDLTAFDEVVGSDARAWRDAEERVKPLLWLIEDMIRVLILPALHSRLVLCGVHAVRNLDDSRSSLPATAEAAGDNYHLCIPSVVRNVARLLQRNMGNANSRGRTAEGLRPHVAELVLQCAGEIRQVAAQATEATIFGRWVTGNDLGDYLEQCEARSSACPLPEASTLQAWPAAAAALVACGACIPLASARSGLPGVALELRGGAGSACGLRLRARAEEGNEAKSDEDVLFVGRHGGAQSTVASQLGDLGVGLPLDPEFFELMRAEATVRSVFGHLEQPDAEAAKAFRFRAPDATAVLRSIRDRLSDELDAMVSKILAWAAQPDADPSSAGVSLGRLLHLAGDLWQARFLLEPEAKPPATKRPCGSAEPGAFTSLAARLETLPEVRDRLLEVFDGPLSAQEEPVLCVTVVGVELSALAGVGP